MSPRGGLESQYDDIKGDSLEIVKTVLSMSVILVSLAGILSMLTDETIEVDVILIFGSLLLVSSVSIAYSVYVFSSLTIHAGRLSSYLSPHSLSIWLVVSVALGLSGVIFFASGLVPVFTDASASGPAIVGILVFIFALIVSVVYIRVFQKLSS
jgi:hypothetical protein